MYDLKRKSETKFCIWTKEGRRPAFFHRTLEGATKEAERLAMLQPGDKFIVMQVMDKVWAQPVKPANTKDDPVVASLKASIAQIQRTLSDYERCRHGEHF